MEFDLHLTPVNPQGGRVGGTPSDFDSPGPYKGIHGIRTLFTIMVTNCRTKDSTSKIYDNRSRSKGFGSRNNGISAHAQRKMAKNGYTCFLIVKILDSYRKSHAVVRIVAKTLEVAVLRMRSKIWPKIN